MSTRELNPQAQPAAAPEVIIIGAGVAGLACATLLADHGLRVLVVEADTIPGGRARNWADPATGDTVDIGPHILLNKYPNMLAWLERLGRSDQVFWQTDELLTVLDQQRHLHFKVVGCQRPCTGCVICRRSCPVCRCTGSCPTPDLAGAPCAVRGVNCWRLITLPGAITSSRWA